jgi:tetratricopeptide (TPR) repeat protein
LGLTADAAAEFSEAVRFQPENADAHYNLGIALAQEDRVQEAASEFDATVLLRPDDANARFNLGISLRGWASWTMPSFSFQKRYGSSQISQMPTEQLLDCDSRLVWGEAPRANKVLLSNIDTHADDARHLDHCVVSALWRTSLISSA